MKSFHFEEMAVHIEKRGADRYEKASYPIRFGSYSEVISDPFVFQFNLNGEIKHVLWRNTHAMEPTEWLKRTAGNDWVFYSSGGYNGAIEAVGEYYVPCFQYDSNGILGINPLRASDLGAITVALESLRSRLVRHAESESDSVFREFCAGVGMSTPDRLRLKAENLHGVTDGVINVLPPDCRHVDYDVIPLNIAMGCLYNCRFCTVKTGTGFSRLAFGDVEDRILRLKQIYGKDIVNYNSLFLGQNDALQAGTDLIERASIAAYRAFGFESSMMRSPNLFFFASADSFLDATESDFRVLNGLPFRTTINIGLESADRDTLKRIGKPITPEKVKTAFSKMEAVNRVYPNIEITANILYGDTFTGTHMEAFFRLVQDQYPRTYTKGAVYLSPFGRIKDRRALVTGFKVIKNMCNLPAYLYIIQRL